MVPKISKKPYTLKAFKTPLQSQGEYNDILRSKNFTFGFEERKYSKYLPYAFTEQGIYMLMTVLKGEKGSRTK